MKKGEDYGIVEDMTVGELRKKYPVFVYKGYSYELNNSDLEMSFDFEVGEIKFRPRVVVKNVPKSSWLLGPAKQPILENLVFHVGLAEMPSYWKATASPEIVVEAGNLNKAQLNWCHDLFMKGMGEYFYKNKIDFRPKNFLTIRSRGRARTVRAQSRARLSLAQRILAPIGGGKDAVVTYEILKSAGQEVRPFVLSPQKEQKALLKKMGLPAGKAGDRHPIIVQRVIDPTLLKLNQRGYLNGHTPFSAYLAFLATLCAALFDYKYIALSNERSSNEGNVQYLGRDINHQYSKSWGFEKKFRSYSKKYLSPDIEYFSFLRPLYELQIATLFASYPKYFTTFLSCNEAHKTDSGLKQPSGTWCGACAKCLFVFASLYPFVEPQRLKNTFGSNLFENVNLIPLMEELVGEKRFKPFECVGTTKESRAAFYLCLQKTHPPLPPLLKHFRAHIDKKHPNLPHEAKAIFSSWNNIHALPPKFEKTLRARLEKSRNHA